MANKKALLGGQQIKVENFSGFDKSRFNAFTAPLGAIVPMVKQLMIPGKFKLSINMSAQLPPLATDAFLRTHLKVEAFFVPLRLCYGGFQSWFAGESIAKGDTQIAQLGVAKLPRLKVQGSYSESSSVFHSASSVLLNELFGPHSLMDYFDVKPQLINGNVVAPSWFDPQIQGYKNYRNFNIFPFIAYQLCYHHWYRNKLIERPLFAPYDVFSSGTDPGAISHVPFFSGSNIAQFTVFGDVDSEVISTTGHRAAYRDVELMNGHLLQLRQRNYGFDYFTTALPSAQDGQPMSVDTSAGSFTISALRLANTAQHFAEINQLAGPDYIQVNKSRYGVAPSSVVAQRPVLLGSADFAMFTSGVEQTAQDVPSSPNGNPFAGIASRYGRAHAEGTDFVCAGDIDEPGYLMVMCSLVPEANYAVGVSHDMTIFTEEGSIVDLPVASLERAGLEPVFADELSIDDSGSGTRTVFGYQPRYMWHKAGQRNEVHGLFRQGASLEAFIPQRFGLSNGLVPTTLTSAFLKVMPSDLDNITAVAGAISEFGVMIDSKIDLFVSEPLSESVLPSLSDPAEEHGRSVYLKRGGVSVND